MTKPVWPMSTTIPGAAVSPGPIFSIGRSRLHHRYLPVDSFTLRAHVCVYIRSRPSASSELETKHVSKDHHRDGLPHPVHVEIRDNRHVQCTWGLKVCKRDHRVPQVLRVHALSTLRRSSAPPANVRFGFMDEVPGCFRLLPGTTRLILNQLNCASGLASRWTRLLTREEGTLSIRTQLVPKSD